jgi:hypothetical protein
MLWAEMQGMHMDKWNLDSCINVPAKWQNVLRTQVYDNKSQGGIQGSVGSIHGLARSTLGTWQGIMPSTGLGTICEHDIACLQVETKCWLSTCPCTSLQGASCLLGRMKCENSNAKFCHSCCHDSNWENPPDACNPAAFNNEACAMLSPYARPASRVAALIS